MQLATRRHGLGAAVGLCLVVLAVALPVALPDSTTAAQESIAEPVAGAFVYPVGDELDFKRPHESESYGYYVSDGYLKRRGRKKQRTHYGVDLACGSGGASVRAIASGVVQVADANALIKVRTKQKIRLPVVKDGKRTYKNSYRWRTTYKWRTGWGNYVVVKHTLPSGETVHSLYAHLKPKSVTVKRGDIVAAGQTIGKVGRTGRASSSHLHLEIRRTIPADPDDMVLEEGAEDQPTPEERRFSQLQTVDPMAFLLDRVRTYDDLERGTWQARYAMAACRDGIVAGEKKGFEPDDSVTRAEFYRALVIAFRLTTPFSSKEWESTMNVLVDSEILDRSGARERSAGDRITRSEALEILLRCLDRHQAYAWNLSAIDAMQISRDFNREFAGADAAVAAEAQAKSLANAETKARRDAEAARVARARKAAKAQGKKSVIKAKAVKPVKPEPLLDPGFEAAAQSKQNLTRAESCLLIATALRIGKQRYSALETAATRVADSG